MINGFNPNRLPALPPRGYLEQIMDNITKTYCFLWDRKDEHYDVDINWKELTLHFHKNSFRATLRRLNKEGLLSYKEHEDGIHIELVAWDDVCHNF